MYIVGSGGESLDMIKIFTIGHEDFLYREITENDLKSTETAAAALACAACKLDEGLDLQETEALFQDFLKENDHIFFDGFLRICIYDC
jgi:hypothetical protein